MARVQTGEKILGRKKIILRKIRAIVDVELKMFSRNMVQKKFGPKKNILRLADHL